jgi:hypothetical protein
MFEENRVLRRFKMFRIKIQEKSNGLDIYDQIIDVEEEQKAHVKYWECMKKPYYYVSLKRIENGKEQNVASYCNSKFA